MFFSPISDTTDRFLFGALGALIESMDGFFGTVRKLWTGEYVSTLRLMLNINAAVAILLYWENHAIRLQEFAMWLPLFYFIFGVCKLLDRKVYHPVNLLVFGMLYVAGGNINRMAEFLEDARA